MKKLFLSAVLFAALFASCKPEEPEVSQTNTAPEGALVGTFKAPVVEGFECTPAGQQRFAKFGNQFSFVWETGDKIAVLTTQGTKTYMLSAGAGTSAGTFVGSLQNGEQISNRLSYPNANTTALSSESVTMTLPTSYQYADAATFTEIPTLLPSAAVITNNSFVMEHLVGYFAFEISNIPAGSDKFVFEVTNRKKINGSFTADIERNINAFATAETSIEAERTVTINFTPSTEVSTRCFIVPVPTGTYRFTWTMYAGTSLSGFYEKTTDVTVGQGNIKGARLACSSIGGGEVDPYNGHAYVDLGLPSGTKWATCNVGADTPEAYGDYFAWAATEPWYESGYAQEQPQNHWKSGYADGYSYKNAPYQTLEAATGSNDAKWCKYVPSNMSQYCPDGIEPDNKKVLDPQDDAATVNWGGAWRMPTQAEWTELENNCTWTWTTVNNIYGAKVQSNVAGYEDKWIFLPAAGYRENTTMNYLTSRCYYWSSTAAYQYPYNAYRMNFYKAPSNVSINGMDNKRNFGHSVRPVCQ